jgi:phosphoadenosine phosphosulfate reductase
MTSDQIGRGIARQLRLARDEELLGGVGLICARIEPMFAAAIPVPVSGRATIVRRLAALRRRVAGRIVFTTSFGLEDQVLTDAIAASGVAVEIITLDTGRLFAETLELWAATEARYGVTIRSVHPDADALAVLMAADGAMGFRASREARLRCCRVRKVEPLSRALAGAGGWLTGLRGGRGSGGVVEPLAWDDERALWKAAPLADWSRDEVAAYCAGHDVPANPLHAAGYPSIGCQPCTRAVLPGEDERAGRWWWEAGESRECGLHVGADGKLVRASKGAAT